MSRKVVMVKPNNFLANPETLKDNAFMNSSVTDTSECSHEFDSYKELLLELGIEVLYLENPDPQAPDAVFANNWFISFSPPLVTKKLLVLCPMKCESRKREKRPEFINKLAEQHQEVIDLSYFESQGKALEGTGSLVIDRKRAKIFMSLSERSSLDVLNQLMTVLNNHSSTSWEAVWFRSYDETGKSIYHTNVILALTSTHAVVNLAAIHHEDRQKVLEALSEYQIVEISHESTKKYAGNLEVLYSPKLESEVVIASSRSKDVGLELPQETFYVDIRTIEEIGGGSTQCMLGKIY